MIPHNNSMEHSELDVELTIDDTLFFETFLMKVRGKSISFSSFIKKSKSNKIKELDSKIYELENDIRRNFQNISESQLADLSKYKSEMEQIKEEEIRGIQIRNRIKWYEEGEKPTSYFCHLENRNYVNKLLNKVITDDNEEITDGKLILDELKGFYKKLYSLETFVENNMDNLKEIDTPILNFHLKNKFEEAIELEEIATAVKTMKNNKSPGIDGFPI